MKRVLLFLIPLVSILYPLYLLNVNEKADIVVIGAGGAGMSAAIEAARSGKNVILLEKMPYTGGNTIRAFYGYNASNTQMQKKMGINDSYKDFLRDSLIAGHKQGDPALLEYLTYQSSNSMIWLNSIGAKLPHIKQFPGNSNARTHNPESGLYVGQEINKILLKEIRRQKIDLRLENEAVSLVTEKGEVTGVRVVNRQGHEYVLDAKAVIIATGGFGSAPELYVRHKPSLYGSRSTSHPGATGDYFHLVSELDVSFKDLEVITSYSTIEAEIGYYIPRSVREKGALLINDKGHRFVNELSKEEIISERILAQGFNRKTWLLFDMDLLDQDTMKIKKIRGESLEELADALLIDRETLRNSVNKYNRFIDAGFDHQYGRTSLSKKLNKPPYFAVDISPAIESTVGGMEIDYLTRVIDNSGNPIPGLYAAGEATGGIHGKGLLEGSLLTDAIVFGRLAGQSAAYYCGD